MQIFSTDTIIIGIIFGVIMGVPCGIFTTWNQLFQSNVIGKYDYDYEQNEDVVFHTDD